MKTVVIYYGGFLRQAGGAFFHATNLANELSRQGWSVDVITLDSLPIWCRYLPHLVAEAVNLIYTPFGFSYKGYLTKVMYKYFFNDEVDLRVFEDIYLAWNSSIPSVSVLHAVWSDNLQAYSITQKRQNKFRESEARLINKIAHPLVTVSFPYCDYIYEEHFNGTITKKIDVIELGIDQSKFDGFSEITHMRKSLVYCGALEARKNVSFLLDVFKSLYAINSEYRLTIIGDGPDRNSLAKFAHEHQLPVKFLGRLSNEEAVAELHKHEIYVHTSVKESFSYSLLEAKLAGLLTCANAQLQVPGEFIDLRFASFSVDEWCDGIVKIDSQPEDLDGSKYTAERMTQATLNLITN